MTGEKISDPDPAIVVIAEALHEVGFEVRGFKTGFDAIGTVNKSGGGDRSFVHH
jgi:hypothetical protein